MKRQYMKPTMHVVKLQHKCHLLNASPESFNGKTLGSYRGSSDPAETVGDGDEDTLF